MDVPASFSVPSFYIYLPLSPLPTLFSLSPFFPSLSPALSPALSPSSSCFFFSPFPSPPSSPSTSCVQSPGSVPYVNGC